MSLDKRVVDSKEDPVRQDTSVKYTFLFWFKDLIVIVKKWTRIFL